MLVFLDDEQMQQAVAADVLDDEVHAQAAMHLPFGPARDFCEESKEGRVGLARHAQDGSRAVAAAGNGSAAGREGWRSDAAAPLLAPPPTRTR
jgi:hypothetical protein